MPAARRMLTLGQVTEEVERLKGEVVELRYEVNKTMQVLKTVSNCIKALWLVVSPILVAMLIHWMKKG